MERQTIIGSETEYGFVLLDPNKRQLYHFDRKVQEGLLSIIDAVKHVAGSSFEGERVTFENLKAHERAERAFEQEQRRRSTRLFPYIFEDDEETPAMAQRRGYTGYMLGNGARYYLDMAHPEYSCPEVIDPKDAVIAQKAGDRIVLQCAQFLEKELKAKGDHVTVSIYKNNSDGCGRSYGAHENYLVSRALFKQICTEGTRQSNATILFFIARQIVTGAGKVGSETGRQAAYQISQRADFIEEAISTSTTGRRGIINTRDSPYLSADGEATSLARLHVIVGDANMSDVSLYLKFGISSLFFQMLEDGFLFSKGAYFGVPVSRSVMTYHAVSRDLTLKRKIRFKKENMRASALDVLKELAVLSREYVEVNNLALYKPVVELLSQALEGLSEDRFSHPVSASLDWVAKEAQIQRYAKRHSISLGTIQCRTIDLEYHKISEDALFNRLEKGGKIMRIVHDDEVAQSVMHPPLHTRAWIRGMLVRHYSELIGSMRWDHVQFVLPRRTFQAELRNPFLGKTDALEKLFEARLPLVAFLSRVRKLKLPGLHIYRWRTFI